MLGGVADKFFPFDGAPVFEGDWSEMAGLWAPNGLDARTPLVTLGSGLSFSIPAGLGGWVRGFRYQNTTAQVKTAPTNPNTNSNPRIDTLALRLDRNANSVLPVILEGAPAASPVPKTLVQTDQVWEMPIWRATCPGSGSAQNYSNLTPVWRPVSSERGRHEWTGAVTVPAGAAGAVVPSWTADLDDKIASITGSQLFLNIPGIWVVSLTFESDSPVAGLSNAGFKWLGGAMRSGSAFDARSRASGFAGAGYLRQNTCFEGLVYAPEHVQPITAEAFWTPASGTSSVTYTARLTADYKGG